MPWDGEAETASVHLLWADKHQRLPAEHQKLERGKEGFSGWFQRQTDPADALILDLQPPELRDDNFLLF